MDRTNHYETAFEGWLQFQRLCYIAIDETRRCILEEAPVKSLDFIVHGATGSRLLIDVKGKRFPGGKPGRFRRVWENWITADDLDGLSRWTDQFSPGFVGLFVFAYCLHPEIEMAPDTPDLFNYLGRRYLFRAVEINDYRQHMRLRSPRWQTYCLPSAQFRQLVRPVRSYTHAPLPVPLEK